MNAQVKSLTALERASHRWSQCDMDNDVLQAFASYQRAKGLVPSTIRERESFLRGFTQRNNVCLLEATTEHLMVEVGRPGISVATRRVEAVALRAFYSFTQQFGHRTDNPALTLPAIRVPRGTPRPFTVEQIQAMLTSGAYRSTRAMIAVGYYQGFRVSQIAAVHQHNVDVQGMTIRTVGKGNKERTLPLHPAVAELAHTMPDGYWFPSRTTPNHHIRPGSVSDAIREAKLRAGITDPKLTAHSLRHSFGTHLVEAGVDIRIIAELMMHESVATTQIYTGVTAEQKRAGLHSLPSSPIPTRSGRLHAA